MDVMAHDYKQLKLKKSDSLGFGFSILGGAGTELPPIIYDIIANSPAANAPQLSTGDVIIEVNGESVHSYTTREVLTSLRKSSKEVTLKLKTDVTLQAKVKRLLQSPDDAATLKGAITKNDLQGIQHILAKKNLNNKLPGFSNGDYSVDNSLGSKSTVEDVTKELRPARTPSEANDLIGDESLSNSWSSHGLPLFFVKENEFIKKHGANSMPSSPCSTEQMNVALSGHFTMESPKCLQLSACSTNNSINGPYLYPSSCGIVRISKSEDHLQDDNFDAINIDLDDVTASLNTLLHTSGDSTEFCKNVCPSSVYSHSDDNAKTVWSCVAPLSSPDSSRQSSHDSDSPLIQSASLVSPQSPTSSMQDSCSAVYNKITNNFDSQCSSNRSAVLSNTSSFTSPDTDVPDELDWDDTTPTFTNPPTNGFYDSTLQPVASVPSNHLATEHFSAKKLDENKIIIKVAGPKKARFNQEHLISECSSLDGQDKNCIPVLADTLPYQELYESEDETTCFSEKSDHGGSSACGKPNSNTSMMSPPMSEDESDIDSLHSFHFSPKAVDLPSALRLAKRLYGLDGFKKSDVSRHLSKNNEFNKVVAEEYLSNFDFKDDSLDLALRKFLDRFCLMGETQERERVLVHFSKRFLDCNPGTFNSQDAVHTLTCAIMLLNTDLHASNIGRKMSTNEFIDNLADLNDGENFPKDVLKSLYQSIRSEPLKWAIDDSQADTLEGKNKIVSVFDPSLGSNPFLSTPNGNGVVYKKGYVMRKCCFDPHGKRTPFGKRSWKMYFCVIQDLVLYLHKDEHGARRDPHLQYGQHSIRLHHALAIRAHEYAKKEHVFKLLTADQAEYLLQTSDSKELQVWIDAINFVAASLSTPPMAGAVGSQKKFQRPLLPCSITKLSLFDQMQDHKTRLENLEKDSEQHNNNQLDKNAKSSSISSYREREIYLSSEVKRYQTYVYLLQSRLDTSSESAANAVPANIEMTELPIFEARKNDATNGMERDVSSSIVPPPIPSRTRPSDSGNKTEISNKEIESMTTESMQLTTQSVDGNRAMAKRRFSLRKPSVQDEFQIELRKLIKEKVKRDKKAQDKAAKAEKQVRNTATNAGSGKDLSTEEDPEDPRVGTFNRMSALFKFKKLNKSEVLLNEEETVEKPPPLVPKEKKLPPPLPPKPPPNSAIRLNVGTKIDI